jgi:tRNA (guanine37-N1)-methyltransferase
VLIDVITIFPSYLAPAQLSLLGKAANAGIVQIRVHDLREWTDDRHRTVDDTPYGGGAGMVMKPEPWGRAIDALLAPEPATDPENSAHPHTCQQQRQPTTRLLVPTASGKPFRQATAARLAGAERLIFACGRYEGIDARVAEYYRQDGLIAVEELSVGDYVLAGGEVAALVMIEAITRLIPGVVGNAESLVEESHVDQDLVEYPAYTKPPVWRGLEVPEVLLSGHHGRVAAWRAEQSALRTALMRPDFATRMEPNGEA